MPPTKATNDGPIAIKRIGRSLAQITIDGTAPLICNRFSEKARQMMLDKQMGKANVREVKDPQANFEAAAYRLSDGRFGFPATGFKAAIVDAARYFKGSKITMTDLKQMIFVQGVGTDLLVPLEAPEPKMREDTVRNASGVADIRFRPEFWPWRAQLDVIFMPSHLTIESLLALVDAAGYGGIGEWRPNSKQSKSGMYGTFQIVDEANIKVVTQ